MIYCNDCGKELKHYEKIAHGPNGDIHYRCFKVGTAQGQEVDVLMLLEEVGRLKRRVQQLEKQVERLEDDANDPVKHNIRIGGS